jgi:hypothetical protein
MEPGVLQPVKRPKPGSVEYSKIDGIRFRFYGYTGLDTNELGKRFASCWCEHCIAAEYTECLNCDVWRQGQAGTWVSNVSERTAASAQARTRSSRDRASIERRKLCFTDQKLQTTTLKKRHVIAVQSHGDPDFLWWLAVVTRLPYRADRSTRKDADGLTLKKGRWYLGVKFLDRVGEGKLRDKYTFTPTTQGRTMDLEGVIFPDKSLNAAMQTVSTTVSWPESHTGSKRRKRVRLSVPGIAAQIEARLNPCLVQACLMKFNIS